MVINTAADAILFIILVMGIMLVFIRILWEVIDYLKYRWRLWKED